MAYYRQAGRVLLQGGDFYTLPGALQFLYPPFAAVLAAPDSSDITAALDRAVANTEGEPRWRTTGDPVRSRRNGTPSTAVPTAGSTTRS